MLRTITMLVLASLLAGCTTVFVPVPVPVNDRGIVLPAATPTEAPVATSTEEPTEQPAADAIADAGTVDLSGIPYTVQSHNSVSVVQVRSAGARYDGMLALDGELRNDSSEPVPYNIITLRVYDTAGVLLDVGSGGAMEIAPGEVIAFTASANVPYHDVGRYVIEIR